MSAELAPGGVSKRMHQHTHDTVAPFPSARGISPNGGGAALRRYGFAFLFVALALVVSLPLERLFTHPFLFLFFAAVMAAGWYGGTAPGLVAVLACTLIVDYFFLPPLYTLALNATEGIYLVAFAACALVASWISASKKQVEIDLEGARDQLQTLVAERTAELNKTSTELQQQDRHLQLLTEVIPQRIRVPDGAAGEKVDFFAAAPLKDVLGEVIQFATSVVPCDACFVYLLEGDALVLRASKNPHPDLVGRLELKIGQGVTGWVAQQRQPVAVARGASEDPRFRVFNEMPDERFEAFLSVPVASRGRLVGVINLQNRSPYSYSEREIRLLSAIGFLVGAEVETARLETENSRPIDKLETRKILERAKGVLQRTMGISEEEAYLMLQKQSRQRRKSMNELAEAILLNQEISGPSSGS
jgi:putative methionine-R-sulfoxide reductase with GAF domain